MHFMHIFGLYIVDELIYTNVNYFICLFWILKKSRNSTVFHAFLAHVAGVLDRNFSMGCCILHQTLVVLQFCASPQRYATDTQPPTFTLRLLEPQVRLHWLQTLLVILYKVSKFYISCFYYRENINLFNQHEYCYRHLNN